MIGALLIQMGVMAGLMWDESYSDFADIEDNKPIDHSAGFKRRAGVALITAAMISLFVATGMDELDWSMLKIFGGLCLVSYGFFTPLFRLNLNRLRGKHLCYASPSNKYDCFFIRIAPRGPLLGDLVYNAGLIAYFTETSAFALGCYVLLNQP